MSQVHDWIDWVGGLPFEVATIDAVKTAMEPHGLTATRVIPVDGHGCNQLVFERGRS